jgi:hypothetical protein
MTVEEFLCSSEPKWVEVFAVARFIAFGLLTLFDLTTIMRNLLRKFDNRRYFFLTLAMCLLACVNLSYYLITIILDPEIDDISVLLRILWFETLAWSIASFSFTIYSYRTCKMQFKIIESFLWGTVCLGAVISWGELWINGMWDDWMGAIIQVFTLLLLSCLMLILSHRLSDMQEKEEEEENQLQRATNVMATLGYIFALRSFAQAMIRGYSGGYFFYSHSMRAYLVDTIAIFIMHMLFSVAPYGFIIFAHWSGSILLGLPEERRLLSKGNPSYLSNMKHSLKNTWVVGLFWAIYLFTTIALGTWSLHEICFSRYSKIGVSILVSRSTAKALMLPSAMTLITILPYVLTQLRELPIGKYLPLDEHRTIHWVSGTIVGILGLAHAISHYFNWIALKQLSEHEVAKNFPDLLPLWRASNPFFFLPVFTGLILMASLTGLAISGVLFLCGMLSRNAFTILHSIFSILFYGSILVHGALHLLAFPIVWIFVGPVIILSIFSRLKTKWKSVEDYKMTEIGGGIFKLNCYLPNYVHKPGQWAFISCSLSPRANFCFHLFYNFFPNARPFTIGSYRDSHLLFYIEQKKNGWTQELFTKNRDLTDQKLSLRCLYISSPFSSPVATALEDNCLVLISSGVGLTPMLSVIEYMSRSQKRRRVYFIWIAKVDEIVVDALNELSRIPDELKLFLFLKGKMTNEIEVTLRAKMIVNDRADQERMDASHIHEGQLNKDADDFKSELRKKDKQGHAPSEPKKKGEQDQVIMDMPNPANAKQGHDVLNGEEFFEIPQNELPKTPLQRINIGPKGRRANWNNLFKAFRRDLSEQKWKGVVGVYFCGNPLLAKEIEEAIKERNSESLEISFRLKVDKNIN